MADKGKKVGVRLPDNTEWDVPEENLQEVLRREPKAVVIGTTPPPLEQKPEPQQMQQEKKTKGAIELVAPLAGVAKGTGGGIVEAVSNVGKSIFDTVVGFTEGMFTGAPAQTARVLGLDPGKIKFQPSPGVPVPQYVIGGTLTSPQLPTLSETERAPIKPLASDITIQYPSQLISSPYGLMAQPVRTQEEIRQLVESSPELSPREIGKMAGEAAQVSSITKGVSTGLGAVGRGVSALARTPAAARVVKAASDLYTKTPPVVKKTVEAVTTPATQAASVAQKAKQAFVQNYPETSKLLKSLSPKPGQFAEDLIATSLQEFSRTGNADQAVKSGLIGSATGQALNVLGRTFKAYEAPWKTKLAHQTIPMDYSIEHKDRMAARLIETGSLFSRKGVDAIGKRADDISQTMRDAGKKADDWLREASELKERGMLVDKTGEMPNFKQISEGGGIISIDERLNEAFNKFMGEEYLTSTPEARKKYAWLFEQLKKNLPHEVVEVEISPPGMYKEGKKIPQVVVKDMSFEQAKEIKENYHKKLQEIYEKAKSMQGLSVDEATDMRIKKMFADSIRAGEQEAFDKLQQIASGVEIPAGAPAPPPVLSTKPWELTVPGKKGPVSYKEAGQTAMLDYDLHNVGKEHVYAEYPQYRKTVPQQASTNISIAQLSKGVFITPSQIATVGWFTPKPKTKTRAIKAMDFLGTRRPPLTSTGRAQFATGLLGDRDSAQPTPGMQQLIEEQEVKPLSTSDRTYFKREVQ